MTRVRLTALAFGGLFGFAISWGQFTHPDRIREMLLLKDPYMYLMMATAVAVGFVGVRLLRWAGVRALITGERVSWSTSSVERRHVVGAAIFGAGWALTDACPAPIAGQLAQGALWSVFTMAGVGMGILLFFRQHERHASPLIARPVTPSPAAASDPGAPLQSS